MLAGYRELAGGEESNQSRNVMESLANLYEVLDPEQAGVWRERSRATEPAAAPGKTASSPSESESLADMERRRGTSTEMIFRRTIGRYLNAPGEPRRATVIALDALSRLYRRQRAWDKAEPLLRQLLAIRAQMVGKEDKLPPNLPDRAVLKSDVGEVLARQQKYEDAKSNLSVAYNELPAARKADRLNVVRRFIALCVDWGKPDLADSWRDRLRARVAPESSGRRTRA